MAKRLNRTQRKIRDHPERFDFGDIPSDQRISLSQRKAYDALRPQWAKDLIGPRHDD